jgi:hypothetical protein
MDTQPRRVSARTSEGAGPSESSRGTDTRVPEPRGSEQKRSSRRGEAEGVRAEAARAEAAGAKAAEPREPKPRTFEPKRSMLHLWVMAERTHTHKTQTSRKAGKKTEKQASKHLSASTHACKRT